MAVPHFFEVDRLQKTLPSLFHLYQPRFEPLPEFVVGSAAHIARVPDIVFDKFLDLVIPLGLYHRLLDRLHGDHESVHVLD